MTQRVSATEIFIGRDNVLQQLETEFKELMENSHGCIILISGEAGVGKTTVVNRFLNTLLPVQGLKQVDDKPQFCILQATCNDITASGNPYAPFAELFNGFQYVETIGFKETLRDWAQGLGPKLLEGIVPYLGPFLAGIAEKQFMKGVKDKHATVMIASGQTYQFLQLLERASKISPLVLFIDDLHWVDGPSLNLIFALAQRISEMPILLIGAYRPHDIPERPGDPLHPLSKVLLEMQRYSPYKEISLEPFSLDEVKSFLVKCLPNNRLPSSFAVTLHNETSGNPFFLDQVLRLLIESGDIFLDSNNQWSIKPPNTIPIPQKVSAVVQARIENLDSDSYITLRYASVLGEQFRSSILSEIMEKPHLDILRTLRTLENHHNLVRQTSEAVQSALQPNWEFNHTFVHQTLYDSLTNDERVELHPLAIDALELHFPTMRRDLASELAYHCEAAKRYKDAVGHRLIAAQRVHRARGFSEQVRHCTKGIAAIKHLRPSRIVIEEEIIFYSGLADAYRRFMNLQKVEDVACELLDLAKQYNDPVAEIEGNLRMLQVAVLRGDKNGTHRYSSQAWRVAQQSTVTHHLVPVIGFFQHGYCVSDVHRFIPEQLKQFLERAINICRNEKMFSVLSRALMSRGIVAFLEDEYDHALSLFTEAIKVVGFTDSSERQITTYYPFYAHYFTPSTLLDDCFEYIGRIHRQRREWEQAIREFERVYERKEAEKNLPGMAGLLNVIAETQLQAGNREGAEQSFEKSWTIAQQTDSSELKAMVLSTGISVAIEMENDVDTKIRLQMFEEVTGDNNDVEWIRYKKQMTRETLNRWGGLIK